MTACVVPMDAGMGSAAEQSSRLSTVGFVIRLVTSIVVPVALIGSVLWWFVARDQLDQALEARAVTIAAATGTVLDGELTVVGELGVAADPVSVDAVVDAELEPLTGSDVELRLFALDGTVVYSPDRAEIGEPLGLDGLAPSVLRGLASGRIGPQTEDTTAVAYSVPVSVDGRTLAVARVDLADDRVIAGAAADADRLIFLFGGALLAIVVALVPLCWWSLGEVRRQYRRTRTLAMNDNLTGLANRTQFHERLDEAIAAAGRSDAGVGLVLLDLDGFKAINDTGGHAAGDRLLKRVAAALGEATRRHEVPCRLGGDEFAVVVPRLDGRDELRKLADRLHEQLDLKVQFNDGRSLRVTASLGLALYPEDADNADDLVNVADKSMYGVKAARKAKLPDEARERAESGQR